MTTENEIVGSSDEDVAVVQINDPIHEKIINEQIHTEDYKISYWKLYSYAKKQDWVLMIFGLICAAIAGAAVPAMTIVFGQLLDSFNEFQRKQLPEDEFTHQINNFTLIFVYLSIVSFFTNYFFMACWAATGERITRRIREEYLRAVLRQNIAYFDKLGAGEVTTRITNDTHLIQDGISEKVSMAFSFFIQFIASLVIAFTKSWKLTLAIFGLVPIMLINGGIFNKFIVKHKTKVLNYCSNAAIIAEESISTIRTAVAFSQQKNISKIYESKLENAKKAGIKSGTLNGLFMGSMNFFIYLTYALAFWYGSTLIISGQATPGIVVNVFFSVLIGSYSLNHIMPDILAFNSAQGAGNKIFETINRISPINIESEEGDKLDKVDGRIQLKNVSFVYPSRPEIKTLKNVSLDIEPGTTVALVGSSGSGKSTIVSLVLRFYDPIEGEILFDGRAIKGLNLKWLRRQMSLVGQEPVLFNTTIKGNVAHGLIGSIYENIDEDKKHEMIVEASFSVSEHNDIEKGIILDYQYTSWELFKKIGKINRPEWYLIFIGLIASFTCGIVYPLFAYIFGKVINAFAEPVDDLRKDARFWSLMFLVVAIIIMISSFVQGFCFGVSGENLILRIRSLSFAAMLRQDISFFDKEINNVGALTSSLSMNATEISGLAGITFGTILQILSTIIVGIIIALIVGWKLTLVVMTTIPLLIIAGYYRFAMMSGFKARTQKAHAKSAQLACEGTANIRTVASLTREEDLWKLYSKNLDEPMKAGYRNAIFGSITYGISSSVNYLANALAFWYGARLFAEGEYDLFRFFTVFMAVLFGAMSSGRIFSYAPDITKAKASANSIMKLLESVPKIDAWSKNGEKIENVEGHIEFSKVCFRYPTRPNISVLRGLNLEIKPGQFAALVGPSGCGKSTTVGLIERFYDVISGKVKIDGIDISTLNVNNLREHISLVSQEPSLYDMTIKENILFGCKPNQNSTQEDIERVCKEANIHDFIVTLPEDFYFLRACAKMQT
ncbi:ABC transporter type 1, transmembrane domain-containing protein [Glomus cerebriforme]|uniref:ABC transporter type 1, transmembrane domain-containing protein n=1 Tax=Glomus cerebriforme TaxID=658196 RepID=A0A397S2V6_9GLOM|nr:ABC transporter type 1, transmembrane domain-containing protein [Glomus cerebriforme]